MQANASANSTVINNYGGSNVTNNNVTNIANANANSTVINNFGQPAGAPKEVSRSISLSLAFLTLSGSHVKNS